MSHPDTPFWSDDAVDVVIEHVAQAIADEVAAGQKRQNCASYSSMPRPASSTLLGVKSRVRKLIVPNTDSPASAPSMPRTLKTSTEPKTSGVTSTTDPFSAVARRHRMTVDLAAHFDRGTADREVLVRVGRCAA